MIDIALSNYNSQGIQKILDEHQEELQIFLQVSVYNKPYTLAQELVSLVLSEHFNCQQRTE